MNTPVSVPLPSINSFGWLWWWKWWELSIYLSNLLQIISYPTRIHSHTRLFLLMNFKEKEDGKKGYTKRNLWAHTHTHTSREKKWRHRIQKISKSDSLDKTTCLPNYFLSLCFFPCYFHPSSSTFFLSLSILFPVNVVVTKSFSSEYNQQKKTKKKKFLFYQMAFVKGNTEEG